MSAEIRVDARGLLAALRSYREHSQRSTLYILEKQAVALCIGAGTGGSVKGLFQEARDTRPETIASINAYEQSARRSRRGLRRAPGMTWNNEVKRRRGVAGYYQASGWIPKGLPGIAARGVTVKTNRGSVSIRISGNYPRIKITNSTPGAAEFGRRTGYIARALANRKRDMEEYCRKKMASDAAVFTRATASNQEAVGQQMDRLLRGQAV